MSMLTAAELAATKERRDIRRRVLAQPLRISSPYTDIEYAAIEAQFVDFDTLLETVAELRQLVADTFFFRRSYSQVQACKRIATEVAQEAHERTLALPGDGPYTLGTLDNPPDPEAKEAK